MRAVSFFGAAAFMAAGSATGALDGGATGLSGTVGRAPSDGGFGGGAPGAIGFDGGVPMADGGRGGPGGAPADPVVGSLLVSFFGAVPSGAAGLPGTLIRTVSRFTAGCSLFGGSVMRMVSFFVGSSADSEGSGEFSSAIVFGVRVVYLTHEKRCQYVCPPSRRNFLLPPFFRRG